MKVRGVWFLHAALVAPLLLAGCKPSGLVWKEDTIRAELAPSDVVREFDFQVTNTGAEPVRILAVTPSCSSCTQVRWDAAPVAAGATSTVTLLFDSSEKAGPTATSATVRDDRGGTHSLRLILTVPTVATLEPSHLRWTSGDRSRRTVKIWMNPQYPGEPTGIADHGLADLAPALRKLDDRGHWELELSAPASAAARWQGAIDILTTRPEPRWRSLRLPLFTES
jgi:hypothetical protein